ncbi:MAG: (d)CMP kinase [Saprospiraceae bacterium]|nr:(d)CMP kinase [Saprospiraceae bacterium]
MAKRIIVAIDGHSACGKSTLAKDLAERLHYLYVDSGAMYRAATFNFLSEKIDLTDDQAVLSALNHMGLSLRIDAQGQSGVYLAERRLVDQLRTPEVNNLVSEVSARPEVRSFLVAMQQQIGKQRGVVMDGRDIGSVVFPDAEVKIFLTASIDVRVQRRYLEAHSKGLKMSHEEVRENLLHRDHIDSTRSTSPLIKTSDAVVIDNSNLTRKEQLAMVEALACLRMQ